MDTIELSDQTWSSAKLQEIFAPGRGLKILLPGRSALGHQSVRHAQVLAVEGDEMTISPPQPELPRPLLGQALEITALDRASPGPVRRLAYASSILDVLPDFPAPDGQGPAVVVMFPRPQDIYPTSLRKVRRFAVSPQAPLQLWLEGQRLNLLDISQKGLRFADGGTLAGYRPGDEMKLNLVIHDEPQRVHGRVAAINARPQGHEVSLELGILPLDAWTSLVEVLKEMEQGANSQGTNA